MASMLCSVLALLLVITQDARALTSSPNDVTERILSPEGARQAEAEAAAQLTSSKFSVLKGLPALELLVAASKVSPISSESAKAVSAYLKNAEACWNSRDSLYQNKRNSPVSVEATGALMQVPGLLAAMQHEHAAVFEQRIAETAGSSVEAALERIDPESGALSAVGDSSAVGATAAYVLGLAAVGTGEADAPAIGRMLKFLRANDAQGDPERAARVQRALRAYAASTVAPSVTLISLTSSSLSTTGGHVTVAVTDALGRAVEAGVVAFAAQSKALAGKAFVRSASDPLVYTYTATQDDGLTAGEHECVIEGPGGALLTAALRVTRSCDLAKLTWSSAAGKRHYTREKRVSGIKLAADEEVTVLLVVECDGEGFRPAHGAVTLTAPSGRAVTFLALPDGGRLSAAFSSAAVAKELNGPESARVTVTLGDPAMDKPILWEAGEVSLAASSGGAPPAPSKQDELYKVAPEIRHMHRPKHQEPLAIFPLLGAAAALTPLALWLLALSRMGLNLSGLPKGAGGAMAQGFVVAIAGAIALSIYFWFKLTVVELALPLLSVAVVLVVVGHQALSSLANERLAAGKKTQ